MQDKPQIATRRATHLAIVRLLESALIIAWRERSKENSWRLEPPLGAGSYSFSPLFGMVDTGSLALLLPYHINRVSSCVPLARGAYEALVQSKIFSSSDELSSPTPLFSCVPEALWLGS